MMANLTSIEDLPPETQTIAIKAMGLREQNARMTSHIEQLGGQPDVHTARMEHLMVSLVQLGVITEHALWEITLDWEATLRPQLKSSVKTLQEIYQQKQEAERQAARRRPGLILPRGTVRPSPTAPVNKICDDPACMDDTPHPSHA